MKQLLPALFFGPLVATLIFSTAVARASTKAPAAAPSQEYRQWIVDMKKAERGPFSRLRWFCTDGRVTPPKPYVCGDEGGHQHGEWSRQTKELRDRGYKIANLLAGADGEALIAQPDFVDSYNQMLIEKYLVAADDGWILRRALFYRGAMQQEDEAAGGRNLLEAMIAKSDWIGTRFPALRIGVRLLPHGRDTASVQKVRQLSASLSDQDEGFKALRGKIHGTPDAGDAQRVRDYAAKVTDPDMKAKHLELAQEIDEVYQSGSLPELLESSAKRYSGGPWLQMLLRDAASAY
ncbi:MAG: pyruvate phosphate dikinase, partial [Gammaproteobacteria bacterium]|nr:pyruvate phosphate dikinase [Gammaproteobacteria bacterium]